MSEIPGRFSGLLVVPGKISRNISVKLSVAASECLAPFLSLPFSDPTHANEHQNLRKKKMAATGSSTLKMHIHRGQFTVQNTGHFQNGFSFSGRKVSHVQCLSLALYFQASSLLLFSLVNSPFPGIHVILYSCSCRGNVQKPWINKSRK